MGVWATLKHPNIVPLYGYIVDEHNHFPIMISEVCKVPSSFRKENSQDRCKWCENGDASEYLEDPQKRASKSRHERIKLVSAKHLLLHVFTEVSQALEVAEGVAHIHSLKLVHGDIKPVISIWHAVIIDD
jgi:serine/threonine protein kinase